MDSTQTLISLGHAFRHCASTGSYWFWIVIAVVASIGIIVGLTVANNKAEVNPMVKMSLYFLVAALVLGSIFARPCTLAQNTSEAAAARGNYIGY